MTGFTESVVENKHSRRPDVLLFVNGLPLAVLELKNPAAEDATIWNTLQPLQTYHAAVPTLFAANALLAVSDGAEAGVGTLGAGREWFKPWRTIAGETLADAHLPELQVVIESLCAPCRTAPRCRSAGRAGWPGWEGTDDERGALEVVMTGAACDPANWQPHIGSKPRREALAKRFRDPQDPFRIVLVRDMWLAGFDAPNLCTMYIDKPMRGHGLTQATARVNRVFRDEPGFPRLWRILPKTLGTGPHPPGCRQRSAARSSSSRASTQRLPCAVSSRFQNGARVLR